VRNALNAHLTREAVVHPLGRDIAEGDWHARFSANERRYLYRILNRAARPALDKGKVWHVKKPLDADAMHAAAKLWWVCTTSPPSATCTARRSRR
jgi:tRNA pseudouridine38-40 synthase